MSLTENQKSLIQQIENTFLIEDRFSEMVCINVSENGERRGSLSFIFRAKDTVEDQYVALKFMDPEVVGNRYRLNAFHREPDILKNLSGKKRCLSLIFGPSSFEWDISLPGGVSSKIDMDFFATEWLSEDIEQYFLDQNSYETIEKLKIFRSSILAVQAFHSEGVSHRDIKYDNFRGYKDGGELVVVVIDFGTSAKESSPLVADAIAYPDLSVGAPAYSAPEALAGLASCRNVSRKTDIYALGALLFQLFNIDLFAKVRQKTGTFNKVLTYLHTKLSSYSEENDRLEVWDREVEPLKLSLMPPTLLNSGHSVPPSVQSILEDLHQKLTYFDHRDRCTDLAYALERIDIAIRILENHSLEKRMLERKRKLRQRKRDKIIERDRKCRLYLERVSKVDNYA